MTNAYYPRVLVLLVTVVSRLEESKCVYCHVPYGLYVVIERCVLFVGLHVQV